MKWYDNVKFNDFAIQHIIMTWTANVNPDIRNITGKKVHDVIENIITIIDNIHFSSYNRYLAHKDANGYMQSYKRKFHSMRDFYEYQGDILCAPDYDFARLYDASAGFNKCIKSIYDSFLKFI